VFTLEELHQNNGQDGRPMLISLRGIVYDVSCNTEAYGPDGSYHALVGHEVARNLAITSLEPEGNACIDPTLLLVPLGGDGWVPDMPRIDASQIWIKWQRT
jgi:predicted heme/steroid binding protein